MTVKQLIKEAGYEEVIIFNNPSYDSAFIGVTTKDIAVYDYDKMIEWHIENDGMSYEEAEDFIQWNDSFYYGEGYPIIIRNLDYLKNTE